VACTGEFARFAYLYNIFVQKEVGGRNNFKNLTHMDELPAAAGILTGLRRPNFACVDQDGNVYVTETGEVGVLLVSPHGDSRRRIGDAAKPPPGQPSSSKSVYARIQGGKGIAVLDDPVDNAGAPRRRRLFVADSVANKVFVMDAESGQLLSEFGGYVLLFCHPA
jgi:hypothetical protein